MRDVFGGSGFFTEATNHSGLCGCVTQPPRSDQNSTRRFCWKMCRMDDFTSTTTYFVLSQIISASAAAAQPRTAWSLTDYCMFGSSSESERCFCLGTWTAEICTVLLASVLGQAGVAMFQVKKMVTRKFPQHAQSLTHQVTTPAHPSCLSRLPWFSPRTHEDSSCACSESAPSVDARYSAVAGSACSCVFEAGSDREDRSSDM